MILEKYLSQDYLVYNHFKKIFEKKVETFGKEKMEKELNILDHANTNIRVSHNYRVIRIIKFSRVKENY